MSTQPRLEARVSALERRQTNTETHVEEVNGEITAEIKQLARSIEASFKQASDYDTAVEKQIDTQFNQVNTRLNKIETTMATKEDLAAMETRILDAFRQLLATIKPQ